MESPNKTRAITSAVLMLILGACATPQKDALKPADPKPVELAVTQVGTGQTTRYVYCESASCPAPTPKHRPEKINLPAVNLTQPPPMAKSKTVEVEFPFNSSTLSPEDLLLLKQTASVYAGAQIQITARSDFVGPANGQQHVVQARAKAMRNVVAAQAPGARIDERQEIAGPSPVPPDKQARQRLGTVIFSQSAQIPTSQGDAP